MDFKKLRDESFANDLSKKGTAFFVNNQKNSVTKKLDDDNNKTFETIANPVSQSIQISFKTPEKINCIVLQENLANGQQCAKFTIQLLDKNKRILKEINGTTIGHKRILTFPETEVNTISLSIQSQKQLTRIAEMESYLIEKKLVENK